MRALNRHLEGAFDPSKKEKHSGPRKLAQEQWANAARNSRMPGVGDGAPQHRDPADHSGEAA